MSKRTSILKALAGTSWGQQKDTLLTTYKAIGRSVADYAVSVWGPDASKTSISKLQVSQNNALRVVTGCHRMAAIDHLHQATSLLPVADHADLLSTQYLVKCLDSAHPCGRATTSPSGRHHHAARKRHCSPNTASGHSL